MKFSINGHEFDSESDENTPVIKRPDRKRCLDCGLELLEISWKVKELWKYFDELPYGTESVHTKFCPKCDIGK